MIDTDLYGDEWVQSWLDGETEDHSAIEDVLETLSRTGNLYDARDEADAILGDVKADTLEKLELLEPLTALVDGNDDPVAAYRDLRAAIGGVDPNHPRGKPGTATRFRLSASTPPGAKHSGRTLLMRMLSLPIFTHFEAEAPSSRSAGVPTSVGSTSE